MLSLVWCVWLTSVTSLVRALAARKEIQTPSSFSAPLFLAVDCVPSISSVNSLGFCPFSHAYIIQWKMKMEHDFRLDGLLSALFRLDLLF